MIVRIAAAQYPIDAIASWETYADKLGQWTGEAAANGAKLLLFPEYGAMELARMFAPEVWSDLRQSIDFVGGLRPKIDALHAELAERHDVYIVAASLPERDEDGVAHNVARVISPKGRIAEQRKLIMTRFEREQWHIEGSQDVNVFKTRVGTFGVAICYDAEFPLIARAMSEAGASMILAPSCTDSLHGYHRVRVAAQARALENQCYVVQSPTVGEAPWSPAVDVNVGAVGVFGPPDLGFPEDGVVTMGVLNAPGWVYADLDLSAVARVRREGKVLNDRHWVEQPGAPRLKATVIEL
jgi:predicted amidohydrolase